MTDCFSFRRFDIIAQKNLTLDPTIRELFLLIKLQSHMLLAKSGETVETILMNRIALKANFIFNSLES
jgi:hypothetical protein